MSIVTVADVRDVLNVNEEDIPDDQGLKMIKRAEVTIELETSTEIDYLACSEAEKEAITVLAAIYGLCFLTIGPAAGWNLSGGELNANVPSSMPNIEVLQGEFNRLLEKLKKSDYILVTSPHG